MTEEKFSERYGYKSEESALIYENAPEQIRVGLREVLAVIRLRLIREQSFAKHSEECRMKTIGLTTLMLILKSRN